MSGGSARRRCYYEVLGVARDVDADTLKKQCVTAQLICHIV
jgi:curved DNA-binding protein CbpA